jgi:hypothetical protein
MFSKSTVARDFTIGLATDETTIRACAALRRRIFLSTYPELTEWPSEPDVYDSSGGLFVVRAAQDIVGTALIHIGRVEDGVPFWIDQFGIKVRDLLPWARGQRIAEIGRLAIEKRHIGQPLHVATALASKISNFLKEAGVNTTVAVVFSETMLAFYRTLAALTGASFRVHPIRQMFGLLQVTYIVVQLPDT